MPKKQSGAAEAAEIWRKSPELTVKQAMRAAGFTRNQSEQKNLQLHVNRLVPNIRELPYQYRSR